MKSSVTNVYLLEKESNEVGGPSMTRPIVAIVGRPNVGKSTLLNRIVGRRVAIVEDLPGTTRDRLYADASWAGRDFSIVDTGGLEVHPDSEMIQMIKQQVEIAIEEASVIIFLVDGRDGVTAMDLDVADQLRRSGKPVVLAVNKVDNQGSAGLVSEFYKPGLGEPVPISAYHGRGTEELLDRVIALLPPPSAVPEITDMMKLAIVGRPNVGKSMLLNSLLGQERTIVSEIPGTTRDAIDTVFEFNGERFLLIDTAGIKRAGRIGVGVEKYSVIRAHQAIERADIALLVTEAPEGITAQDSHIAGFVSKAYKGVVIIVNKWDLIENKDEAAYEAAIRDSLRFLSYAPILFISAALGTGVKHVLPLVKKVYEERLKRIPTHRLNEMMQVAWKEHNPPSVHGKRLKMLFVTQAQINPPTFVFFVNNPTLVHFSYRRYLENRIRDVFGFTGTSIQLIFKARGEK